MYVKSAAAIERGLEHNQGIDRACRTIAQSLVREIQSIGLREAYATGEYVGKVHLVKARGRWRARAAADHSAPIEGGTGIYGPTKMPVVSKSGKLMVFKTSQAPSGGRGDVQARDLGGVDRVVAIRTHKGMPGRHIVRKAIESIAASSPRLRARSSGLQWVVE